jgi:hypothetical protein
MVQAIADRCRDRGGLAFLQFPMWLFCSYGDRRMYRQQKTFDFL